MAVMEAAFDPAYGEAWTRAQLEGALMMGTCYWWLIAPDGHPPQENAEAAGFALIRQVLDEAELLLFAISPQYRRRGLGDILLKRLLEEIEDNGVASIMLEMRSGNPAEFLYRNHSFLPIGRRPNYYRGADGTRLDAITFRRDCNSKNL